MKTKPAFALLALALAACGDDPAALGPGGVTVEDAAALDAAAAKLDAEASGQVDAKQPSGN